MRWGNSAGILLPKEMVGSEARVIIINHTLQIKKEVLSILEDNLQEIQGIYLTGSYARNEQDSNSDIDIIAISNKLKKEVISGKYHISVIPLSETKKTILDNPLMIMPRLIEAKTLLNQALLNSLTSNVMKRDSIKGYIKETGRILKINKELIDINKSRERLDSNEPIYSIILRLRGLLIIKCLLNKEKYSNTLFKKWLSINTKLDAKEIERIYSIYKGIKENKPDKKAKISLNSAIELIKFAQKEASKYAE
jgi:predicted nucleotidyltransferase